MQFPQINRDVSNKPSGLGAFYAKSGIQFSSSPQRPVGGRSIGMKAPQNAGMAMGVGMGRPMGMPPMMPYGAAPSHPQMGGGGLLPHIGAPRSVTEGGMGGPMGGGMAPAMGANLAMGSVMNMQAQLLQKRRINMALKQRAVQQHQQQKMRAQREEPMIGAQPYAPGGRRDYSQSHRQQPPQRGAAQQGDAAAGNTGDGNMDPGDYPLSQNQPDPPKDPRDEAFDMGKKMAQMEQFMNEMRAEKEEAKQMEAQKTSTKDDSKVSKKELPDKENKEDDEVNLEPEEMNLLDKLENEVRAKVAEGSKALHELEMTDEELRLAADAAGKEEMREKFRDRLENQQRRGKGKLPLQPLWRHVAGGNPSPPKDRVMKGKSLLRACAWGIVVMFVRPAIAIRRRKLSYKEKEQAEFRRTLDAFNDACTSWWGSVVRIPVASLQEGNVSSLRPKKTGTFGKVTIRQELLTTLKVRVRAVVKALKSARMPPDYLTSFLVTLLDDDNYFYDGFLFEEEEKTIDLNEFGGTRGMVREIGDKEEMDVSIPCKKGQVVLGEKSVKRRKVDASRARLLLQNFVLIRVLLNKCLLAPWTARISRRPKAAQMTTQVDNLRVLATVLYMALRQCNPNLPEIKPDLSEKYKHKLDQAGSGDGDGDGDEGKSGKSGPQQQGQGAAAKTLSAAGDDDDDDDDANASAAKGSSEPEYKEGSIMYYLFGPRQTSEAVGQKRGPEDLLREDLAYGTHASYAPLLQTVDSLIPLDEFAEVRSEIDTWLTELAADIDTYTDRLLVHVLESRPNVLHDDFHTLVDGHEDAPEGELTEDQAARRLEAKLTARREEKEENKVDGDADKDVKEEQAAGKKPSVAALDLKGAGLA